MRPIMNNCIIRKNSVIYYQDKQPSSDGFRGGEIIMTIMRITVITMIMIIMILMIIIIILVTSSKLAN